MGQKYAEPAKAGTLTPEAQAAIAEHAGQTAATTTSTSSSKIITGVSLGVDPTTGEQIYPRNKKGKIVTLFPAGYEQTYIKSLPPKSRAAFQKKMLDNGLYPDGYAPTLDGMITTEDFNAIAKLVAVGEQKGIGDINKVLDLAKTDAKVKTYLQTGGYSDTGTKAITDITEAKSNLNSFFLDMFNDKPSKEEIKAYQNALNAREKSAKGGMSAQERDDIILSIANKRLSSLTAGALTGDMTAAEKLDEGQLGKRVREIRAQYEENGIPVSDRTAYKLAGKSFRNETAWDTIQEDIVRSAALQWGKAAEGLKPGQTVRSRVQPYITIRSQIRGIPEDQIKTQDVVDALNPDGTLKNIADYKTAQYQSNDYLTSDAYKSTVLNDTKTVLRNFGVM